MTLNLGFVTMNKNLSRDKASFSHVKAWRLWPQPWLSQMSANHIFILAEEPLLESSVIAMTAICCVCVHMCVCSCRERGVTLDAILKAP